MSASAIGFSLAFVAASWLISAVLCLVVELARPGRLGPAADRAAANVALVLAPVLALVFTATLVAHSAATGGVDHCGSHDHHLHLCVFHGGAWADQPAAVVLLAMVGAFVAIRLIHKLAVVAAAARGLARLRAIGEDTGGVILAPANTGFSFVAGFGRPRIYVSTATWNVLAEDERRALVAHEQAHLAARDPWRRFVLGLAALVGSPWLAARMLVRWAAATERVCDAHAARAVDATAVASALVAMARCGTTPVAGTIGFPAGTGTVERVEAVLAGGPTGMRAGRIITRFCWAGIATAVVLAGLLADPIHHLFETLLGAL